MKGSDINAVSVGWGLLWVVFHALGKPCTFDVDLVGCIAFSYLMANVVNYLYPMDV